MNLGQLRELFVKVGVKRLYVKTLAHNDNSKQQVYFGSSFEALNLFPNRGIYPESSTKNPIFKAGLDFSWLLENGNLAVAPGAQLILYPQYPEVRFSGFLKGCRAAPSALMVQRTSGRVLFLGVSDSGRIVAFVADVDSGLASEYRSLGLSAGVGVFVELSLPSVPDELDSRSKLLLELGRVNRLGWIDSKQLDSHGNIIPCNAPQCGGFTLEAELGIAKNSNSEPDFLGWEVKQHKASSFERPFTGTAITLMTPEPTGGYYKEAGVESFIRRFGYADRNNREDRMNFGGIHKVGECQSNTHLTMVLSGFDSGRGKITDADGAIMLVTRDGDVAASWAFSSILSHWSRKHMRAAYVPSICQKIPYRRYHYAPRVRLAQRTDSLRFIEAMASGVVYYDPGIKLENASTKPVTKRRSQFRIASKNIARLYETVEEVAV